MATFAINIIFFEKIKSLNRKTGFVMHRPASGAIAGLVS
jgi:hypothetical protein